MTNNLLKQYMTAVKEGTTTNSVLKRRVNELVDEVAANVFSDDFTSIAFAMIQDELNKLENIYDKTAERRIIDMVVAHLNTLQEDNDMLPTSTELSKEDTKALLKVLDNPHEANDNLKEAFRLREELIANLPDNPPTVDKPKVELRTLGMTARDHLHALVQTLRLINTRSVDIIDQKQKDAVELNVKSLFDYINDKEGQVKHLKLWLATATVSFVLTGLTVIYMLTRGFGFN